MNNNITIIDRNGTGSSVEAVALVKVNYNSTEKEYLIYSTPGNVTDEKTTIQISQLGNGPGAVEQIEKDDWENFKNI